MPRRKTVVVRDERFGNLKLPEEAHERLDKFQHQIVSLRNWLAKLGFVLLPVDFNITKKM